MKTPCLLFAFTLCAPLFFPTDILADDIAAPKEYRCVTNGLRAPTSWREVSNPSVLFRFRRKAFVEMTGKLQLVFPTFYMDRKNGSPIVEEIPFPNSIRIQCAIEPAYKMSNTELESSPRIVSEVLVCEKESSDAYKILTVDLGDAIIRKGEWYGIWVMIENADGGNYLPFSRSIASKRIETYEAYHSPTGSNLFEDKLLETISSFKTQPLDRKWARNGYCPVMILAKCDPNIDVWAILGSSIPEGYYDINGDHYGDENANAGYADKLISTRLGAPSVNLAKGGDRFMYCAQYSDKRLALIKLSGANKVHFGLGGNDLNGRREPGPMVEDSKLLSEKVRSRCPDVTTIVGATILPHSISTDKFQTFTGQTPREKNAGTDSLRGRWNTMLRADPTPSGCDDIFELCNAVEYDWENSASLWGSPEIMPNLYTPDGTHPSCDGSSAIANNAFLIHGTK